MGLLKKILAIFLITALLVPGLVVVSEANGTGLSYCQFSKGPCKHGNQCPLGHNSGSKDHNNHHNQDNQDDSIHDSHEGHSSHHNRAQGTNIAHDANHSTSNQIEICHKDDNKASSIIFTVDRDRPLLVASSSNNLDDDAQFFSPEDKLIYNDHLSKPPLMPPLS